VASRLVTLDEENKQFAFSYGRTLQFMNTPYSHSAGSFVTFDPKGKTVFTSDLFGSYGSDWRWFLELKPECIGCANLAACPG
jgi:flavorubredoxin